MGQGDVQGGDVVDAGPCHDVIAGTALIYSWDARAARLRFLSRAQSAFSIATRIASGFTSCSGTLTSRTPLS